MARLVGQQDSALPLPRVRRRSRLLRQERIDGFLFIGPWLLGFLIWIAGPMLFSLYLVGMDWSLLSAPHFVGLDNLRTLKDDDLFFISLKNTAYYTFIAVPLHLLLALAVALCMNVKLRFVNVFRTIYYMPSITPQVASVILWVWIFNPDFGLANALLRWLRLPTLLWLQDPATAKPTFIIMSLWGIGSTMIIFLAGLQGVPETLYEAAKLDGASQFRLLVHITLPMISPVIFFNLVIGIIGSFQVFTTAYIATNGGPANSTLFLVLYLYRNGFQYFKMGYASTIAWALFLIVLVFTLVQFKIAGRWVHYEGERV